MNDQPTIPDDQKPDHHAVDLLGEKLTRIRSDLQEVLGLSRTLAGEKLGGLAKDAVHTGKAAINGVTAQIEANPLRSTLIAVGVGALVGFLIRRR